MRTCLACALLLLFVASVQGGDGPEHRAFRPVNGPEVPRVRHAGWPRNPIDHSILARLEPDNIAPSPEAARRTLTRRLHLDPIGLPPPEEVEVLVQGGQGPRPPSRPPRDPPPPVLDHKRLTFRHQGLDVRLTGVAGQVVAGLVA